MPNTTAKMTAAAVDGTYLYRLMSQSSVFHPLASTSDMVARRVEIKTIRVVKTVVEDCLFKISQCDDDDQMWKKLLLKREGRLWA